MSALAPSSPPAPDRRIDADRFTCGIRYIKQRAGALRLGNTALVRYVAALVADSGFPEPFPLFVKGQGNTREVRLGSRWNVRAVDAWFDGQLPPDLACAISQQDMARAADTMDQRAANLRLVGASAA